MTRYRPLEELIAHMEPSSFFRCRRILEDNQDLFASMPGSTHNHQAWPGGYRDHVTEVMNIGWALYGLWYSTGRLEKLPKEEQFRLGDVLLILFLHDLEKLWRIERDVNGQPLVDDDGKFVIDPRYKSKPDREALKYQKIAEYGLKLTPNQLNALRYVEGMRDADYTPDDRVMRPLATVCHTADMISARLFYGFPLAHDDPWKGAKRTAETLAR